MNGIKSSGIRYFGFLIAEPRNLGKAKYSIAYERIALKTSAGFAPRGQCVLQSVQP